MKRVRLSVAVLVLGILLAVPETLLAQGRSEAANAARLQNWDVLMKRADGLLLEGEYKKARKILNPLIDEMVDEILTGDAKPLLATVSLLRALAEAGLGHERDALWDLHVAKSLDEKIAETSLAAYGEAGEFLSKPRVFDSKKTDGETGDHQSRVGQDLQAPRIKKQPKPKYPLGKRYQCLEDDVVVLSVIDKNGLTKNPELRSAEDAVLGFVALQALRDWRFEPARLHGEPIAVYYNLQMNFEVPRCPTR